MLGLSDILWILFYVYWLIAGTRVKRTVQAETIRSLVVHTSLIYLAFALVLAHTIRLGPLDDRFLPDWLLVFWAGIGIQSAGIGFAVWARLHLGAYWSARVAIKDGHRLIRSGPYALVRNPIYTGMSLGMLGSAIALGEWRGLVAVAVLLVAIWRKIAVEESYLMREFGPAYDQYRHDVKALIPFVL